MFEHHRKSPWFAEKYDPSPELVQLRARVRKVGWKGRLDSFLLELDSGKYDPDLNEPEPEVESASAGKDATNGDANVANGADPTKSPVISTSGDDQKPGAPADDDMQFNVEPEDDAGEQDASRADMNGKQSADAKRMMNRGEEISIPPEGNQVMIRTIPPDIGRQKLEEVRHCQSLA